MTTLNEEYLPDDALITVRQAMERETDNRHYFERQHQNFVGKLQLRFSIVGGSIAAALMIWRCLSAYPALSVFSLPNLILWPVLYASAFYAGMIAGLLAWLLISGEWN